MVPFCFNWLDELLQEGLSSAEMLERLVRAGFSVDFTITGCLGPGLTPDYVLHVGLYYPLSHENTYARADAREKLRAGRTIEEHSLMLIEQALREMFAAHSQPCEMCGRHYDGR